MPEFRQPTHSPMPSRPSLPPPTPPKGAKRVEVKQLSQASLGGTRKKTRMISDVISLLILIVFLFGVAVLADRTGIFPIPFISKLFG